MLLQILETADDEIEVTTSHCQGLCHEAPVALLDAVIITEATAEKIARKWKSA